MKDVSIIIVSYNVKQLLKSCIESIRKFYPDTLIILIDGSPVRSECFRYIQTLRGNIKRIAVEYNIGHGNGMKFGINMTETKYILLCDSDVEIKSGGVIEAMQQKLILSEKIYGTGQIVRSDHKGMNAEQGIDYLHPHFALINRAQYFKHHRFIHHGAPLIRTMVDVRNKKTLLMKFDLSPYIIHHSRGTRDINPSEFNSTTWDKVQEQSKPKNFARR